MAESIESDAWADFYAAAPPGVVASYGVRVEQRGGVRAFFAPPLPDTMLNRALGVGLVEPAAEDDVADLIDGFRRAGSSPFAIPLSPVARPEALPRWLEARGLRAQGGGPKLVRGVEAHPAVSSDLRISQVELDQATSFAQVAVDAFGLPGGMVPWIAALVGRPRWRTLAAFDGDLPVAVGVMFVQGEVGWLGFDATLASHRRRGAQSAIIARRIADAASLGCRRLVAETGEDTEASPNSSFHNFRRMGFRAAYHRPSFEPSDG